MQTELEAAEYGSDLPAVQKALERHRFTHQEVQNFRGRVEKCAADKVSLN